MRQPRDQVQRETTTTCVVEAQGEEVGPMGLRSQGCPAGTLRERVSEGSGPQKKHSYCWGCCPKLREWEEYSGFSFPPALQFQLHVCASRGQKAIFKESLEM